MIWPDHILVGWRGCWKVRFGPVKDCPLLDPVPIAAPCRASWVWNKNTALLLVSLLALLLLSAKGKRLHWYWSPGISIFPSSFSLDSPYLVGEMHCTVRKALHCRKQSRLAGYSPGLAVFVVDGDKNQLVSPAVYRTSLKEIIPSSLRFPWYCGKRKKPIPNHLSLFLTLNCPQTLFYLKICPLYITIHTQTVSPLGHRAFKIDFVKKTARSQN